MAGYSIGRFRRSRREVVEALAIAIEATTITLLCCMLLGSCAQIETVRESPEALAARRVAYATCLARQSSPIITEVLRQAVDATVPGGEFVHGTISIACSVVLANPPPIAAAGEVAQ